MNKQSICTACGYAGKPIKIMRGNFIIEIILWLFFILPGIIYSIWRSTSKYMVCPICKNQTMIPVDSPNGQKLLDKQRAGGFQNF